MENKKDNKERSDFAEVYAKEMMPREKLKAKGAKMLETSELLAILLRTGSRGVSVMEVADRMLHSYGRSLLAMSEASVDELSHKVPGLGEVKAIEILAALELGRRRQSEKTSRMIIRTPDEAYECLAPELAELDHEEFWVVVLGSQGNVLHKQCVSQGGWSTTAVDVRMLLSIVLQWKGTSFIAGHNHPNGGSEPSKQDRDLTQKMVEASGVLGLRMRDHIIVARGNGYYSFMENNML